MKKIISFRRRKNLSRLSDNLNPTTISYFIAEKDGMCYHAAEYQSRFKVLKENTIEAADKNDFQVYENIWIEVQDKNILRESFGLSILQ